MKKDFYRQKKDSPPKDFEEESLIINKPEALGDIRKGMEWSITTIGWAFWFFLCRPLILIFLWYLGIRIFYTHMIRLEGLSGLAQYLPLYTFIIIVIFFTIRGWALYNLLRYGKRNRRVFSRPTSQEEMEEAFHLPLGSLSTIQNWQDISIDFSQDNHILIKDSRNKEHAFPGYFRPS